MTTRPVHPKSSMRQRSDFQLLRAYIEDHNHDAFTQLVHRYIDLVFTSARRQVRDAHIAEDVTQHVFIKLSAKAHQLTDKNSLQGWLLTATRYAALDAIKHRKRRWRREQEAARSRSSSTKAQADLLASDVRHESPREDYFAQLDTILDTALSQLNPANRNAVVARFFQNKSYREIAEQLGVPQVAARQRVSRSLRRLRRILADCGVSLPPEGLDLALLSRGIMPAPTYLKRAVTKTVGSTRERQKNSGS